MHIIQHVYPTHQDAFYDWTLYEKRKKDETLKPQRYRSSDYSLYSFHNKFLVERYMIKF